MKMRKYAAWGLLISFLCLCVLELWTSYKTIANAGLKSIRYVCGVRESGE